MPETKRPLKVFLCHAHADRDPVRGLYTRLTNDGVDAWLDKAKLLPGQDWELEIRKAVREADVVVVCLSKQFNQAGFRQKEVRLALDTAMEIPDGEIFIIPARLEECDNLESLRKWHWVDLFESDGYERLLRALRVRADKIGATLQVKRSWLPRITTPRTKNKKPAEIKKVDEIPESKLPPKDEAPLPQGNFPDGWDTEWMPSSDSENAKIEGDEKAEREENAKQLKTQNSSKRSFNITSFISVMAIVFCVASVTLIPILSSLSKKQEPTPTPQIKLKNTVEVIRSPSSTLEVNEIPSLTSTPVITATLTPLPTEITDAKGVSMMLVPAGEFVMGSNTGNPDEQPAHVISLDAFYMDKYEVTNALYKICVETRGCTVPYRSPDANQILSYDNSLYSNHPVVYVDGYQAKAYCEWRDARLPTEAEWEKAARGTKGQTYPWGEGIDCSLGKFDNCAGWDTRGIGSTLVGSYEKGISPYKIYDMAGNAWEWVADWYDKKYYINSPINNPLGPNSGQYRIIRGGSYYDNYDYVRSANRNIRDPDTAVAQIGFRCAKDENP